MSTVYTHTNINTPDWKKLSAFYEKVFGMEIIPPLNDIKGRWFEKCAGMEGSRVTGCQMRLPGYQERGPVLELFTWVNPDGTPANSINGGGFGHIAFAVDSVDEMAAMVIAEGGSLCGEVVKEYFEARDRTISVCYARDPDGNCIELIRWDKGDITK